MISNEKSHVIINSPAEIEFELKALLNIRGPAVVFDIGACTGEDTIRYAKLFPNAKIHAFEPRQDNIENMKKLVDHYKVNITIAPIALSNSIGKSTFHLSSGRPENAEEDWDYGNKSSSLIPPSHKLKEYYPWLKFNSSIEVETSTLDEYCRKNSILEIDFIHMDVQGAELSVLKGASNLLRNIKLIWLEVENVALYESQPLKKDVEDFMKAKNFLKLKDTSGNAVAGDCLFLNKAYFGQADFYLGKYLPFLFKRYVRKLGRGLKV